MKKEAMYFITLTVIALGVAILYYWGGSTTGFAVFGEYTNESDCVVAGYSWENLTEQQCTNETVYVNETYDCDPCLGYETINATNETNSTQGACISWTSCVNETSLQSETCVNVVISGQCVGDVCDSQNLNLCLDETSCTNYTGYWYDSVCNADECADDSQCVSGYECSGGSCSEIVEEITSEEEETPIPEEIIETPIVEIPPEPVKVMELVLNVLTNNVIINPNKNGTLSFSAKNTGNTNINSCGLSSEGDYSGWISLQDVSENFNPGESKEFSLNVAVPEGTAEGSYSISASLNCVELSRSLELNIEVVIEKIGFDLIDVLRTREDRVRVVYELEELIGVDQNVELQFSILGGDGKVVSYLEENKSLDANKTKDFRTTIFINESFFKINESSNESLDTEFGLLVNLNSQVYSSSVQEKIVLGAPISGFAVLEGIGAGGFAVVLGMVFVLALVIFVARRMRKKRKTLKTVFKNNK